MQDWTTRVSIFEYRLRDEIGSWLGSNDYRYEILGSNLIEVRLTENQEVSFLTRFKTRWPGIKTHLMPY